LRVAGLLADVDEQVNLVVVDAAVDVENGGPHHRLRLGRGVQDALAVPLGQPVG
jgi:hypothetical protein